MDSNEIKLHLNKTGWKVGRDKHWHRTVPVQVQGETVMRQVRTRFNKLSLAVELLSHQGKWIRIAGASYDVVRRTDDGGLQVLSYIFPK